VGNWPVVEIKQMLDLFLQTFNCLNEAVNSNAKRREKWDGKRTNGKSSAFQLY